MVDFVSRLDLTELQELVDAPGNPKVSLCLPTFVHLADSAQVPIRLKNLLNRAAALLTGRGTRPADARALLEPCAHLSAGHTQRLPPRDGLALLVAPGRLQAFDLPYAPPELVVAGEDHQLVQLLPLLDDGARFYLLALSQGHVALYVGTRTELRRLHPGGLPASLAEVLRYDDPQAQLQWHTRTPQHVAGGPRHAIFHGHGAGTDDELAQRRRLCERISAGLQDFLQGSRAPLVLAGVEPLLGTFRQVCRMPGLLEQALEDNPALLDETELHQHARVIAEPALRAEVQRVRETFSAAAASGLATAQLVEVLRAAAEGRVEKLLVRWDRQVWGVWHADRGALEQHEEQRPQSADLVNSAALAVLRSGGQVHVLAADEMPADAPACALLRY